MERGERRAREVQRRGEERRGEEKGREEENEVQGKQGQETNKWCQAYLFSVCYIWGQLGRTKDHFASN